MKRITVDEALAHPYLQALHCVDDEVKNINNLIKSCKPVLEQVSKVDFEFENYNLTLEQLKGTIL